MSDSWSDEDPIVPQKIVLKQNKAFEDDDWSEEEPIKPKKVLTKTIPKSAVRMSPPRKIIPEKVTKVNKNENEWSDEDVPIKKVKNQKVAEVLKPSNPKILPKVTQNEDDWSDDDVPIKKVTQVNRPKIAERITEKIREPVKIIPTKEEFADGWSDDEEIPATKPAKIVCPPPNMPKIPKVTKIEKQNDGWSDDEEEEAPVQAKVQAPIPKKVPTRVPVTVSSEKIVKKNDNIYVSKPIKGITTNPLEKFKDLDVSENIDKKVASGWDSDESDTVQVPTKTKQLNKNDKKKNQENDSNDDLFGENDEANSDKNEDEETKREPVVYIPEYYAEDDEDLYSKTICAGINFNDYDDIKVKVTGDDKYINTKINTWKEANLCPFLHDVITKKMHWETPTPIQKVCVPLLKYNLDLMACAQTGSGKTGAFAIPIIQQMLTKEFGQTDQNDDDDYSEKKPTCSPKALVVAPARELVMQIQRDFIKLTKGQDIKCEYVIGGHAVRHQLERIENSDIIIATPGRLNDFVEKNKINLSKLKFLILDEADRMLETGFEQILKRLALKMPDKQERQTAMFSATFPDQVQALGHSFMKDKYIFVAVGTIGGAAKSVTQTMLEITENMNKEEKLLELLKDVPKTRARTVVFVETRRMADYLATKLCLGDYPATSIHGDRAQQERELALRTFIDGDFPILVATNVAARGLDIPDVAHVINLDLPKDVEEYVHRIGRTGRCGNVGKATSFYKQKFDKSKAKDLKLIFEQAHQPVPDFLVRDSGDDSGICMTGLNPNAIISNEEDVDDW